jgi:hypothetical protein
MVLNALEDLPMSRPVRFGGQSRACPIRLNPEKSVHALAVYHHLAGWRFKEVLRRFRAVSGGRVGRCGGWFGGFGVVRCFNGVMAAGAGSAVLVEAMGKESWIVVGVVRVDTDRIRDAADAVGHVADDARGVVAGLSGADPLRHCGDDALGQGFAQAWAGDGGPDGAVAAADQLAQGVTERRQRLEAVARVCEAADDAAGEAAAEALAIVRAG